MSRNGNSTPLMGGWMLAPGCNLLRISFGNWVHSVANLGWAIFVFCLGFLCGRNGDKRAACICRGYEVIPVPGCEYSIARRYVWLRCVGWKCPLVCLSAPSIDEWDDCCAAEGLPFKNVTNNCLGEGKQLSLITNRNMSRAWGRDFMGPMYKLWWWSFMQQGSAQVYLSGGCFEQGWK
jgi:hypothetical protein